MYYYRPLLLPDGILDQLEVQLGNKTVTQQEFVDFMSPVIKAFTYFVEYLRVPKPLLLLMYPSGRSEDCVYKSLHDVNGAYRHSANIVFLNVEGEHPVVTVIHELRHAWQAKVHGDLDPSNFLENDAEQFAAMGAKALFGIEHTPRVWETQLTSDYQRWMVNTQGVMMLEQKFGNTMIYRDQFGQVINTRLTY